MPGHSHTHPGYSFDSPSSPSSRVFGAFIPAVAVIIIVAIALGSFEQAEIGTSGLA